MVFEVLSYNPSASRTFADPTNEKETERIMAELHSIWYPWNSVYLHARIQGLKSNNRSRFLTHLGPLFLS
jgi:hypothetical protein